MGPARLEHWQIIVLVLALAAFVVMLTWDRGHFPGEQPEPAKQVK